MLRAAQAACSPWPLVSSEHDDTNRSRMVGTSESTVHRAGLRVMMYPARMKWLYTMNCSMLTPHLPCRVVPDDTVQHILTLPIALALRAREIRALLPYYALLCKIRSLRAMMRPTQAQVCRHGLPVCRQLCFISLPHW